jgi:hypothetical protein
MRYGCPVCGFDALDRLPADDAICPSCGTHFGYEDFAETDAAQQQRWWELRDAWFRRGAPWFSPVDPPPPGWNPYVQALEAGLGAELGASESSTSLATVSLRELDVA